MMKMLMVPLAPSLEQRSRGSVLFTELMKMLMVPQKAKEQWLGLDLCCVRAGVMMQICLYIYIYGYSLDLVSDYIYIYIYRHICIITLAHT